MEKNGVSCVLFGLYLFFPLLIFAADRIFSSGIKAEKHEGKIYEEIWVCLGSCLVFLLCFLWIAARNGFIQIQLEKVFKTTKSFPCNCTSYASDKKASSFAQGLGFLRFQVAIYTVFHEESVSEVEKCNILEPEGKK